MRSAAVERNRQLDILHLAPDRHGRDVERFYWRWIEEKINNSS
jgi:hypothetical protein